MGFFSTILAAMKWRAGEIAVPPADPPSHRIRVDIPDRYRNRVGILDTMRVRSDVRDKYRVRVDAL